MADQAVNRDDHHGMAVNGAASSSPPDAATATPTKKKQKRNKPTLSCEECVERKTKVRPLFLFPIAAVRLVERAAGCTGSLADVLGRFSVTAVDLNVLPVLNGRPSAATRLSRT